MKKTNIVKASLFTLILAFIAIGTIAVAKVMNKEKTVDVEMVEATAVLAPIWFEFTGDPNKPGEMEDNTKYQPILDENDNPTEPECEEGNTLCAVKVIPDPQNSDLPDQGDLTQLLNNAHDADESEIRYKD